MLHRFHRNFNLYHINFKANYILKKKKILQFILLILIIISYVKLFLFIKAIKLIRTYFFSLNMKNKNNSVKEYFQIFTEIFSEI